MYLICISIHASAKEATHKGDSNFKRHNFNPRLREGGDINNLDKIIQDIISIHASAKEATAWETKKRYPRIFQSTPPRRRRPLILPLNSFLVISIHASAKEATRSGDDLLLCFPYFNPRLREGGDLNTGLPLMEQQKFQSTPPRRRRPSNILAAPAAQDYFNPRLREGGDIKMHLYVNHDGFQSTPPRRRRPL